MRLHRREAETFSLSFLDVIACGFGAVILLLIITLAFEPSTVEKTNSELKQKAAESQTIREDLIRERQNMTRELELKKRQVVQMQAQIAAFGAELRRAERQFGTSQANAEAVTRIEEQLKNVQQSLSEEMRRLLNQQQLKPLSDNSPIGGIPVDSEYIIFVIDTSGSMKQGAWPLVVSKMQEILNSYPRVKGIQVINDRGSYMFPTFAGQWISDSPARREVIIQQLRNWSSFSASNPAPGIIQAIQTFHRPNQPTSIFVFGDDFNGKNIDEVISVVARWNKQSANGQTPVRIHTFGFPVLPILLPKHPQAMENFSRFAHLMRLLAEQNSGGFVGLNNVK